MLLLAVYVAIGILSVYVSIVQSRKSQEVQELEPEVIGVVIVMAAVFWPWLVAFRVTKFFFAAIGRAVQSRP
jgi:hypothetical protein